MVWTPADAGGRYRPVESMVPVLEFPPMAPSTAQVTPVFDVPFTVAVNCMVWVNVTDAARGLMLTAPPVTVTAALAERVGSTLLVAVTVCEPAAAGAVYTPPAEMVPTVVLPPVTPSTDHWTFLFLAPVTVALNCTVALIATAAEVGLMLTVTPPATVTVTAALAAWVVSA